VGTPAAHILIVEDHEPIVRGFTRALAAGGYAVDSAPDGVEGFARLRERSYDAVVTDLNMPRMNGLDFLAKVREAQPDVPVILMTGELNPDAYARARAMGVVRYLLKPVRIEQLGRAVENAVKLRAVWAKMQGRKSSSVP
jgi:DNA-binding NtrC family response regulator